MGSDMFNLVKTISDPIIKYYNFLKSDLRRQRENLMGFVGAQASIHEEKFQLSPEEQTSIVQD